MALTLQPGTLSVASAYPDPPFDLIESGSPSGFDIGMMRRARSRHAGVHHHFLGESLRRLEARGCSGRSERRYATRSKRVGDTRREGRLGSDDDEVDALVACQLHDSCDIGR